MISSFCNGSNGCVDASAAGSYIAVTDTKDTTERKLLFTREEWDAFTAGVKAGEFDSIK